MNDLNTEITFKIKELNLELINPSTKSAFNPSVGGSKTAVLGKPGCFAKGTEVLKYDGTITNVESVKVGDCLMGDDSTPRNVIELCRNFDDMYKITPLNTPGASSYVVNALHKLVLVDQSTSKQYIEITVKDFLKKPLEWQQKMSICRTAVDFKDQQFDLDAYFIGLWLGSGTISRIYDKFQYGFTPLDINTENFLIKYFQENNINFSKKDQKLSFDFDDDDLKNKLEVLLFFNPHISHLYKVNTREKRLKLLAGLIDAVGTYNSNLNVYSIKLNISTFMDDIIFIARSLGFMCYKTNNSSELILSGWNLCDIPCKIDSKIALQNSTQTENDFKFSKFSVTHLGIDSYFGFTLDDNHRFLLASCDIVRNTGKSTLIASLLYAKKHIFPVGMIMSGSEDSNHFYERFIPKTFIYNEYDEDVVKNFVRRQKIAKEHLDNPWAVLLLDDCTDDAKIFNKPLQNNLFKLGRHYRMWYILSLQYAMDIRPVIRVNIDNVFILREPSVKIRKSIWENYASIIPDFGMFCDIMDQLSDDYTALFIKNDATSNKMEDCVFYYKAKPIPSEFKFGCKEYWAFHKARYDENYQDSYL